MGSKISYFQIIWVLLKNLHSDNQFIVVWLISLLSLMLKPVSWFESSINWTRGDYLKFVSAVVRLVASSGSLPVPSIFFNLRIAFITLESLLEVKEGEKRNYLWLLNDFSIDSYIVLSPLTLGDIKDDNAVLFMV